VQKLILPKSSLMNIPIDVDAKLLIIPEKDVDEYDVMMLAEETSEMVRQLRIDLHKVDSKIKNHHLLL
jgi:hypothetical protein